MRWFGGRGSATALGMVSVALWGSLAALGVKLQHVPPFLLVGMALGIGSLVSLPRLREWRLDWRLGLLGLYGLFGYHFCLFVALRLAPPVEANLVNYLWPLLIVVLAPWVVPGTRLTRRHVLAAAAGFAGAALLITGGRLDFDWRYADGYGFALLGAFMWSTYSLLTRRIGAFPTATVGMFCALSSLLALVCHVLLEEPAELRAADAPWLLLLGLGPMGAAFFTWDAALKRGDPRAIGALAYLTPLLSTLVLVASGAGRIAAHTLVAVVLIVGGAVLGNLPARGAGPEARRCARSTRVTDSAKSRPDL